VQERLPPDLVAPVHPFLRVVAQQALETCRIASPSGAVERRGQVALGEALVQVGQREGGRLRPHVRRRQLLQFLDLPLVLLKPQHQRRTLRAL
jgi:hypothetical protein